ncbi:MAG: hypothetical protein AB7I38_14340 [Dehalococcoidia bacterium]
MTTIEPTAEGLRPKYHVERLNDPDGKHDHCRYFVLDPQHDPIAREALRRYMTVAREQGYGALADDLWAWIEATEPHYVMEVQPDGRLTVEYPESETRDAVAEVEAALRRLTYIGRQSYRALGEAAVAAMELHIADRIAAETEALREERRKFQAETATTWFLAERLRAGFGASTLCDRCKRAKGESVVTKADTREWVCRTCLDGTATPGPVHLPGVRVPPGIGPRLSDYRKDQP